MICGFCKKEVKKLAKSIKTSAGEYGLCLKCNDNIREYARGQK